MKMGKMMNKTNTPKKERAEMKKVKAGAGPKGKALGKKSK